MRLGVAAQARALGRIRTVRFGLRQRHGGSALGRHTGAVNSAVGQPVDRYQAVVPAAIFAASDNCRRKLDIGIGGGIGGLIVGGAAGDDGVAAVIASGERRCGKQGKHVWCAVHWGALGRDADLGTLFMFEGRRLRGDQSRVRLSNGFLAFSDTVRSLVRKAQTARHIDPALDPGAITSAVLGAAESMMRDRMLAKTAGRRAFAEAEIRRTIDAMLSGFETRPRRKVAR